MKSVPYTSLPSNSIWCKKHMHFVDLVCEYRGWRFFFLHSPLAPISPRPEGLTRLNYGSMTSVTGKLEAQNQALDVIGCILMSDPKVRRFTGRGTPTTPDLTPGSSASTLVQQKIEVGPPSHDDENDLDQDTDIFDL